MKKSTFLRSTCLLALLAGLVGYATAAPYGRDGREVEWVQPDGQKLKLRVFGDEYYARTETAEGYTVTYSAKDGAYYYAGLSADGSDLVPLPLMADKPAAEALIPHLDLSGEKIREKSQARHSKADEERKKRWAARVNAAHTVRSARGGAVAPAALAAASAQAAPVTGDKLGLTVLIQFPNDETTAAKDPVSFPTDRNKIVRYCNGVGYTEDGNTGSVRDFFFDQSGGKLSYTQLVTSIVTMPKARNFYNYSDYPRNKVFRQDSGDALLTAAIAALKAANFDFSALTLGEDNRVLATNILFAGPDSGVWAQGLWPYQTTLPQDINVGTTGAPIYISSYQQTNIENAAPVIGTFCHENGHLLLDYSDLYDYGRESQGVGDHCLMGGGNYNNRGKTPSPINAYFKDAVGWANVVELTTLDAVTVSLPTTGNVSYRLAKPGNPTEFFIVENRGDGDKWAKYSIDKGIAIWHVDSSVIGDDNEQMTSERHYEVSLEQADGKFDLEFNKNRGDSGDLFATGKSLFTDATLPNANWWDGTDSAFKARILTAAGPSTNVHFGRIPVNTIAVASPNGGEVFYAKQTVVIAWDANIQGNVKIDLYKGDVLKSVLSPNEPNSGKFAWVVPSSMRLGAGCTLKISSLTNSVPAVDTSDSIFTVGAPTFPLNNAIPYGWSEPGSAAASWVVTKKNAVEGRYSLTNKPIGDGKTAAIAYKSNFSAGKITFYMKTSSERGFDYARFFIDGVPQVMVKKEGTKGISGQTPWTFFSFPLSAGTHTLKWTYEKDDTYTSGQDSAWLDAVILPITTQDIVVQDPAGENLLDGSGITTFPTTQKGFKSKPQVFTIKNKGKADLTNLKIVGSGGSVGDFIVSQPLKKTLRRGDTTTFEVTFSPTALGSRTAQIQVLSNDGDESTFTISLQGKGAGAPKIVVFLTPDKPFKDGKSVVNFGFATVKTEGKTRTFTISNRGDAVVDSLKITKTGSNKGDFQIGALGVNSLDPGDSTTFSVTFKPSRPDHRIADLHIASNDLRRGVFDISLTGTGAPMMAARSSSSTGRTAGGIVAAVFGAEAKAITGFEVIKGEKYLALSVAKLPGGLSVGTVEVSSDLLDWYSGKKHTTVLIDDEATLKVRDNLPYRQDAKRYIRLK